MGGSIYLDGQPLDDGAPYHVSWDESDLGFIEAPEPTIEETASGPWAVYPLSTNLGVRRGRLAVYSQADDINHKRAVLSQISALLRGAKKLHVSGRYLNVYLRGAKEVDGPVRAAATLAGAVANFTAADPLWYLNQPLAGIDAPVNEGDEWALWDDNALPSVLPAYEFTTAEFTLTNWGTAWCYGSGTIAGGPASTTVYLKGSGATRLAVILDATGAGTFTEAGELLLDAGDNIVRVEDGAGALIAPGLSFVISFGSTYMRFY